MNKLKFVLTVTLLSVSFVCLAQIKVSPFISSGYMSHLRRTGLNTEIGIDFELIKRIDILSSLRYSLLDANSDNQVKIKAASLFLSYIPVNNENHRLMVGPGISYGNYERYTKSLGGFEKEYDSFWFNPVKIRYDYKIQSFKVGLDASLYGEDGDDSTYIGLVLSYEI